jgi:hypothetical protein
MKKQMMVSDPCGVVQKGYRCIVRGNDVSWRNPAAIRPGDVDVTDIEDIDELAAIFVRERERGLTDEAGE